MGQQSTGVCEKKVTFESGNVTHGKQIWVDAGQIVVAGPVGGEDRPRYSKRTENFKRPKNREDSSDLDENLTESIAAMRSIISKIFGAARLQKNCFQIFFHASCCLNIYR